MNRVKEAAKRAIRGASLATCRAANPPRGRRGVVVFAPPEPQNRGDEAMLRAAVEGARAAGHREIAVVQTGLKGWGPVLDRPAVRVVDLHPFFCCSQSFREELGLVRLLASARALLVIGADILDGSYGDYPATRMLYGAKLARSLGVATDVVGFSVSREPGPELVRMLNDLQPGARIRPRDPVSYRRLERAGVAGLELAADLALLMEAAPADRLDPETRRFLGKDAGPVVGIGLHERFFQGPAGRDGVRGRFAAALALLARRDRVRYVAIPHHPTDAEPLSGLLERVEAAVPGSTHVPPRSPSAPEAKRIAGECKHVITSRMHVAIAALGMGRPATCFPYLGKFEGLFEHFGLDEGLYPIEGLPEHAEAIADLLNRRIDRSEEVAAKIRARFGEVVALSRRNLAGVLP